MPQSLVTTSNKLGKNNPLPKHTKTQESLHGSDENQRIRHFQTPTRSKEILSKINQKTLPLKEVKKIINIKCRDLMWRFLLKALPKPFNKECAQCGELETSNHIFFQCKSHITNTQRIVDYINQKWQQTSQMGHQCFQ
ncbi:hypothetical protein ACTFIR_006964 [Dictyostelium discoideum]